MQKLFWSFRCWKWQVQDFGAPSIFVIKICKIFDYQETWRNFTYRKLPGLSLFWLSTSIASQFTKWICTGDAWEIHLPEKQKCRFPSLHPTAPCFPRYSYCLFPSSQSMLLNYLSPLISILLPYISDRIGQKSLVYI